MEKSRVCHTHTRQMLALIVSPSVKLLQLALIVFASSHSGSDLVDESSVNVTSSPSSKYCHFESLFLFFRLGEKSLASV